MSGFAIYLHGGTLPVKLQDMLLKEYFSTKSSFHTKVLHKQQFKIGFSVAISKRLNLSTFFIVVLS